MVTPVPPLLFATAAAGVLFVIEIFAPSMRRYIAWLVPAAILFAILLIGSLAGLPPRTALLVTIAAAVVFLVPAVRASIPSRFPAIAGIYRRVTRGSMCDSRLTGPKWTR